MSYKLHPIEESRPTTLSEAILQIAQFIEGNNPPPILLAWGLIDKFPFDTTQLNPVEIYLIGHIGRETIHILSGLAEGLDKDDIPNNLALQHSIRVKVDSLSSNQ